jgi:hypothetical protein
MSSEVAEERDAVASVPPPTLARAVSLPPAGNPVEEKVQAQPQKSRELSSVIAASSEWLRRAGGKATAAARDAIEFLDVNDGWVPIAWRGRIRGSALVGSGALVLAVGVAATVLIAKRVSTPLARDAHEAKPSSVVSRGPLRTETKPASVEAPARPAPLREVAAALPAPLPRSEASLTDEGALLLDSATALLREGRDADAVMLVERALLRNPQLGSDSRVHDTLLRTAHSDDRASAAATFALLEGSMGERGAELMYEISLTRVGKESARRRAQTWLRGKQFAKNAALPLFIAVKLREAKTCEDKHALLPLAAGGGKQTLDYLRELQAHTTCAPDDLVNCYPCLRADNRLSDAISAIEKRTHS